MTGLSSCNRAHSTTHGHQPLLGSLEGKCVVLTRMDCVESYQVDPREYKAHQVVPPAHPLPRSPHLNLSHPAHCCDGGDPTGGTLSTLYRCMLEPDTRLLHLPFVSIKIKHIILYFNPKKSYGCTHLLGPSRDFLGGRLN